MLKLTRSTNQTLKISDNITLHILKVSGQQVRLGIEAPRDVSVVRDDVKTHRVADPAAE